MWKFSTTFAAVVISASPALSQELTLSFGQTEMSAGEYVFDADGNRASFLDWRGNFPTVSGSLATPIANGWIVTSSIVLGLNGDLDMDDYDWEEYSPSFDFDDWDHHSIHKIVPIESYSKVNVDVTKDFGNFNFGAGVGKTQFTTSSFGGSFVYSTADFRDDTFTQDDDAKGITYTQNLPSIYVVGGGSHAVANNMNFVWTGRLGATVGATDTDLHHNRDIRFEGKYDSALYTSLSAGVEYQLGQGQLVAMVEMNRYDLARGDAKLYSISTGEFLDSGPIGGQGLNLTTTSLSLGYAFTF